ncbi:MAG TPA: Gmad2 immunoglobulin-like domain-containing protein [Nocardioidaceae bacterium]
MNDFPHPDRDDERLRRLLEDAVSEVEPRRGLDSIHARTKVVPMQSRRAWLLGAGAAAVATAATVAGVVVLTDGGTTDEVDVAGPTASVSPSPSTGPSPSPSPEPSPSQAPSATAAPPTATPEPPEPVLETVPVYYVGETSRGPRLFREFHRVDVADGHASAAVNQAVSVDPDDGDYRTLWPLGVTAAVVDVPPADVVTVDVRGDKPLRARPDGMTPEQAEASIQQLVYTAQAAVQDRSPVQLLVNGKRTDTVLGVPASEPLAQGDAADVLAQVWIIDPGEGAEVGSPFTVSGLAAAFEATVQWELRKGDRLVADGYATAEECCTMAPYSFRVKAPAGEYTLLVTDGDASGGEGYAPWVDTKTVRVR